MAAIPWGSLGSPSLTDSLMNRTQGGGGESPALMLQLRKGNFFPSVADPDPNSSAGPYSETANLTPTPFLQKIVFQKCMNILFRTWLSG